MRSGAPHYKQFLTHSGLKLSASKGYEKNPPELRREILKGIALPAVSLLILNNFYSYRAPNPNTQQALIAPQIMKMMNRAVALADVQLISSFDGAS